MGPIEHDGVARRVTCPERVDGLAHCSGKCIRCADGAVAGRITALIVDDTDGTTQFAVVCFGSVSRLGEDARVVPMSMLKQDGDDFIVALPYDAIRSAPIFVAGTCCQDKVWWERVDRHFRDVAA